MTTPLPAQQEVTQLLGDWKREDEGALENLMPLVQPELHLLAHHYIDDNSFCKEITAFLTFAACPEGRRLTIFRVH